MSQQEPNGPQIRLTLGGKGASRDDGEGRGGTEGAQLPARGPRQLTVPKRSSLTRARYADFLPELEAVAEREHSPLARILIMVIAALFASLLLWAAVAKVDQVASAPGQVRPVGKVKVINHPEGGTVAAIPVREGDSVAAGQVLLELDPELVREELAKVTNEWHALSAEAARLRAEATDATGIDFPADLAAERPELVLAQMRLFEARRSAMELRQAAAQQVVIQRQSEVEGLRGQVEALEISLDVLVEQETAIGTLAGKGYFPKLRYLSIKRQVAEARGQLAQGRQQLRATKAALAEAIDRRDSLDRDMKAEVLERLATATLERDRNYRTMQQQRARLKNLVLRSPVDGVVQNLKVTSVGQAIRPGDPVMNVVPTGDTLIVEAQVSNADIGFIYVGQPATVKVVTYDFIKYGSLEGEVEQISANSVENPTTGEMMFPVQIRVDRTYLGDEPGKLPVQPGMSTQVDLRIGERSILSYLTDRIARTTSQAFTER